jgi:glutathionyl-hydroquinone reductase
VYDVPRSTNSTADRDTLDNGVNKAGLATTQVAYEQAVTALFATLRRLMLCLAQGGFSVATALQS